MMKLPNFAKKSFPYETNTLQELLLGAAMHYPDSVVQVAEGNETREYPYCQLREDVLAMSGLLEKLVSEQSHVALIGRNSYHWIVGFFGITCAGATAVLLDRESPREELQRLLGQSDVECVLCENELLPMVRELCAGVPVLPLETKDGICGIYPLAPCESFSRLTAPEQIAAIIYTSGSTGVNKGVLLSHENLTSDVLASELLTGVNSSDAIFTVLPPQHAFQLVTGILTPIYAGMRLCIGRGLKYVQKDFLRFRPTFMVLVPMIVRSLYRQTLRTIERKGLSEKVQRGLRLSKTLRKVGIDGRGMLFAKVREGYGGCLRSIICGGAHLEDSIVVGMYDLGITVMTGYGITECSPVVCCNMPKNWRLGSVGRPTPYGRVRIENGEIQVQGQIVSQGYYQMPELTGEAFVDGWFRTGDLGYLDKDGFLFISGRKKNLLILSSGKNVSPEELENALQGLPGVKEACVRLERVNESDYLSALVYPDEDRLKKLGAEVLQAELREGVQALNRTLPVYKRVKTVQLLEKELCHTASGKLLRHSPISEDNCVSALIHLS